MFFRSRFTSLQEDLPRAGLRVVVPIGGCEPRESAGRGGRALYQRVAGSWLAGETGEALWCAGAGALRLLRTGSQERADDRAGRDPRLGEAREVGRVHADHH